MSSSKNQADCLNLGQIGWKYYNSLRKKAVEQEFSWSGLLISLSIAFFIVALSACALNFFNLSLADSGRTNSFKENVYNYNLDKNFLRNLSRETVNINLYNRG